MSPDDRAHHHERVCFPRVSGDEPLPTRILGPDLRFSPRERG